MPETTESPPADTVELVRRIDAIRELEVPERTFDRWVQNGRIPRADTTRPGVWVYREHVDSAKLHRLRGGA